MNNFVKMSLAHDGHDDDVMPVVVVLAFKLMQSTPAARRFQAEAGDNTLDHHAGNAHTTADEVFCGWPVYVFFSLLSAHSPPSTLSAMAECSFFPACKMTGPQVQHGGKRKQGIQIREALLQNSFSAIHIPPEPPYHAAQRPHFFSCFLLSRTASL